MNILQLPSYPFKLKTSNGQRQIFDEVRKKWLNITPEEWVRQHFIMYLIHELQYPKSLIGIEKEIVVEKRKRRVDILLYNGNGEPIVLVECKAPDIQITQKVFDQTTRYNSTLEVPFIVVTNGIKHYCARFDKSSVSYLFIDHIPNYQEITG